MGNRQPQNNLKESGYEHENDGEQQALLHHNIIEETLEIPKADITLRREGRVIFLCAEERGLKKWI